jgi:hypothetical protein
LKGKTPCSCLTERFVHALVEAKVENHSADDCHRAYLAALDAGAPRIQVNTDAEGLLFTYTADGTLAPPAKPFARVECCRYSMMARAAQNALHAR